MNPVKTVWKAFRFEAPSEQEELATWLMIDSGSTGCETEAISPAKVLVKAYFDGESRFTPEDMAGKLEAYGLSSVLSTLQYVEEEEQDWLQKWKLSFKAFPVGERFFICPIWVDAEPGPGRVKLLIEPAMAFGTGLHTTTQFCLSTIEKGLPAGRILDVGTGSGILAIGAALLDKNVEIIGIDNDPKAVENAKLNCSLNHVENRVEPILAEPEAIEGQFAAILSNMTCEDIVALLPTYGRLLGPGGVVIGAGILKEKTKLLEDGCRESKFEIVVREENGEWLGVVLKRS
jgi:ribosomal protein L11 methyltransferase